MKLHRNARIIFKIIILCVIIVFHLVILINRKPIVQEVEVIKTVPVRKAETIIKTETEKVIEVQIETEYIPIIKEPDDYQFYKEFYENAQQQQPRETQTIISDSYAAQVWNYLSYTLGYNDYVCAGILGNMMAECGGHTLELQPFIYGCGGHYYGICQWADIYNAEVIGTDLNYQLDYFSRTFPSQVDSFGFLYYSGFNYDTFMNITDIEQAVVAYERTYGRGGIIDYTQRILNAQEAYSYFHCSN